MITKFKLFENKYQELSEEDFLKILNENCKNFSIDNDPLYRGDEKDVQFMLHNPEERNTRGITYVNFFKEKEKDVEKYPVVRKNSSMGVGGGTTKGMKKAASELGKYEGGPVYRVIPFDNSKMIFCPSFDLYMLKNFSKIDTIRDDNFIMTEYTENFKVPVNELKKTQKELTGDNKFAGYGFEFFTSSPCLLINIENEEIFNEKL